MACGLAHEQGSKAGASQRRRRNREYVDRLIMPSAIAALLGAQTPDGEKTWVYRTPSAASRLRVGVAMVESPKDGIDTSFGANQGQSDLLQYDEFDFYSYSNADG